VAARIRVVDTRDQAVDVFKTFHSRNPARDIKFPWNWPTTMQEAGAGQAEMYKSNKWKSDLHEFEDYKHVAEGPRLTYVTPGWLREWSNPNKPLKLMGERIKLKSPMPKHFCVLGQLLGVQLRLFQKDSKGSLILPKGDEGLIEVRVKHGMLGGAKHPDTGELFVFVYTKDGGIHMIITGDELSIGKDGIEG
jgi:hypothetical protein